MLRKSKIKYHQEWRKANRERDRQHASKARWKKLGIDPDVAQVLRQKHEQDNSGCAICSGKPKDGRWHIDHDHKTGRIRGILCARCNIGLGMFLDQPELLTRAAHYLCS